MRRRGKAVWAMIFKKIEDPVIIDKIPYNQYYLTLRRIAEIFHTIVVQLGQIQGAFPTSAPPPPDTAICVLRRFQAALQTLCNILV